MSKPEEDKIFDLPPGWTREVRIRRKGKTKGRKDVYIISPDKTVIRSFKELNRYFNKSTKDEVIFNNPFSISSERKLQKEPVKRKISNFKSSKSTAKKKKIPHTTTDVKTTRRCTLMKEKDDSSRSEEVDAEAIISSPSATETTRQENNPKEDAVEPQKKNNGMFSRPLLTMSKVWGRFFRQ